MSEHSLRLPPRGPQRGDRVRVLHGRWQGREGTLEGTHFNPGRPGGQQGQIYPIVALEARGRARARVVRVLDVEPVN